MIEELHAANGGTGRPFRTEQDLVQRFHSSSATSMEAEHLVINTGDPVLVIETKLYTRNDRLIGWRRAVHRADDYKFSFSVNR